ncbi:MOSC domain-containing protein [Chryseobacterium mucoviscidosis]|jgi:MOSC domain-containing protein YiiM|uniref:MOSC domain-containing protein n=1 Tax=Paenibacillus TaxID=44249 RepID=UPI0009A2A678|nr:MULTISPECIES: MOSC domain-containing protein [Paenibacillus]MDN8592472.1 MOSC domain-containing protein [Paenibacillus sp. 11B]OPG98582.1 MOSC domain-containing protein [Chryseobacterium mucoviscidosis]OZQ60597.1 MOSC domain-containing protein [Paenibacillus taichungensis]HBU84137.1 MOSC domain-containing protein [Paenibacillus sp.]
MTLTHNRKPDESKTAVLAVNVGQPQALPGQKREVMSGIVKHPISSPVFLSFTGMTGDGQADLEHHGGPDKAVCVYDYSRYPALEQLMDRKLDWGACGENLTVEGCMEDEVRIGDVYELGEAKVQVSQPRQPCFKLGARYDYKELPVYFQESGHTGFYFRVLQEGEVTPSATFRRISTDPASMTILEANRIMHQGKHDAVGMRALLAISTLSDSWKQSLLKRLAKLEAAELD